MSKDFFLDYKEKLSIPLYKYYSNLTYAKDAIKNHRIHFEAPDDYNDIFDSSTYICDEDLENQTYSTEFLLEVFQFGFTSDEKSDYQKLIFPVFIDIEDIKIIDVLDTILYFFPEKKKDDLISIFRGITGQNSIIKSSFYKISCFSENNDSLLMWAYYANSHKGVCLGFDIASDQILSKNCHKVRYSKHFDAGDLSYTYFTKSEQWQHEQEWRIITRNSEYINTNCIKAVYLGYKLDKKEVNEFIELARTHGLDLYYVYPSKNEYKLEFFKLLVHGNYFTQCEIISGENDEV